MLALTGGACWSGGCRRFSFSSSIKTSLSMGNQTSYGSNRSPTRRASYRANIKLSDSGKNFTMARRNFLRDSPNGRVDKKKFLEAYEYFFPGEKAQIYCKYAFDTFDSNNEGTIHFNELLWSIAATSGGDLDDRLSFSFDLYDSSKDEYIDQEEFTKMITVMYKLNGVAVDDGNNNPKTRAATIIASLGIGEGNKLSKQEFIDGCKNDPFIHLLLAHNV
ncbi:unnamed protein product [Rotaria sp. Silwood1]|nr:unnamed protein product [Rotaria sp. Silwood1]CAF4838145.1 unnamed protein product [Rotaria sp. Silwood1]